MSFDLQLKSSCSGCGSTTELYGSNCKHMTLCLSCGKKLAENQGTCHECGTNISHLLREYNVRPSSSSDKNYFIGRFMSGLPDFSKKKTAENRWTIHKEGLQGRQVSDSLREKYKNKPWLLEDETGQSQYLGQLEGSQSATYYLLVRQGKEFVAIPADSWYNFSKVANYKQLTLEEAEEKMKNRRKTADGYQRWMMKTANNGPAAFGETELDAKESGGSNGGGRARKKNGYSDEGNVSDRGEEDGEEEAMRKDRLELNKKGGGENDDDEGLRGGDLDLEDDGIEKGDDWEHDEIFTDDDEKLGNDDPAEREDLDPEVPAPPEIKEDEDEEEESDEEEGGLSKSGKELKKLLGRTAGLDESDADADADDDDEDDDDFDDIPPPPALKQKDAPKEQQASENSPSKPVISPPSKGTSPTSKSTKAKRKIITEDSKTTIALPSKKVKIENESKPMVKDENATSKTTPSLPSSKVGSTVSCAVPVTEDEIRAILLQKAPVTTQVLVANFKARLKSPEEKDCFSEILKRISRIQKTNGANFVVLRDKFQSS